MKIALCTQNWNNEMVRNCLLTCDLLYTADRESLLDMYATFGSQRVVLLEDNSLATIENLKQQHLDYCKALNLSCTFVEFTHVAALIRASSPIGEIPTTEKLIEIQHALNWLDSMGHFQPGSAYLPEHSSWLIIGPGQMTLEETIELLKPSSSTTASNPSQLHADYIRMHYLSSLAYFQPQTADNPGFTTWMLAIAGKHNLRSAIDHMMRDQAFNLGNVA